MVVEDSDLALEAAAAFFASNGVITKRQMYSVKARLDHPDGFEVVVKAKLFRLPGGTVLELRRRTGDGLLFALVAQLLQAYVSNGSPVPPRFAIGQLITPSPPTLRPSPSPDVCVPPLELPAVHESDGLAEAEPRVVPPSLFGNWPLDVLRRFASDHEELWARVRLGKADASDLKEHVDKIPVPLAGLYALKVQPSRRGRAPMNAEALCEKIDFMLAEAMAFWEAGR